LTDPIVAIGLEDIEERGAALWDNGSFFVARVKEVYLSGQRKLVRACRVAVRRAPQVARWGMRGGRGRFGVEERRRHVSYACVASQGTGKEQR